MKGSERHCFKTRTEWFHMVSVYSEWSHSLKHDYRLSSCSITVNQSSVHLLNAKVIRDSPSKKKSLLSIVILRFQRKKHQLKHEWLCAGNIWWKQASRQRWIAPTLGPKKPWCALRPRARAELQEKLRNYSASLNVLLGGSPGYAKQKSPCVIRLINFWLYRYIYIYWELLSGTHFGGNEIIQVYGHFEEFPDLVMHCLNCSSVGTIMTPVFPFTQISFVSRLILQGFLDWN